MSIWFELWFLSETCITAINRISGTMIMIVNSIASPDNAQFYTFRLRVCLQNEAVCEKMYKMIIFNKVFFLCECIIDQAIVLTKILFLLNYFL